MPMGPPSHSPDPKSALRPASSPMLATYCDEWGSTGRPEMSACQKLSAGNVGQPSAPGSGAARATAGGRGSTSASSSAVKDRFMTTADPSVCPMPDLLTDQLRLMAAN